MVFRIEIDLPKIPKILQGKRFEDGLRRATINGVNAALLETKKRIVRASPLGATGELKSSWLVGPAHKVGKFVEGDITTSSVQALVLEKGAKKHFPAPPRIALQRWVRRKLGVRTKSEIKKAAFAVARKRSLARIPPKRIFSKTFDKSETRIRRTINRFVRLFIKDSISGLKRP